MLRTRCDGRRLALALTALAASLASGACCLLHRVEPVPPPVSRQEVIAALQSRSAQVQTVYDTSISLEIEVEGEGGTEESPALGGVLAYDRGRAALWLRAEKMFQEVFDLRAMGEGFSLAIPETREVVTGGPLAFYRLPHLIHPYEAMMWLGAPEWLGLADSSTRMILEDEYYRFDVFAGGVLSRTVRVCRRKLGVSRIVDYDLLGRACTEVSMDAYRQVNGFDFPHVIEVNRPLQGCRIRIELSGATFNKQFKAAVFEFRDRPGWEHIDLDKEPLSSVKAFGGEQ